MVLFPPPFYFVFYISNLLSYIQNNFSYELARPIMGTIFLVVILIKFSRLLVSFASLAEFYIMYVAIREYGSTLCVGLARAVSPTNTNFRLTFFTNPTSGGSLELSYVAIF